MKLASSLVVLGLLAAGPAQADRLRVDRTYSLIYVAAGGAIWGIGETLIKDRYYPSPCRWCDTNALDEGVRDALRWDDPTPARELSNVTGYGLSSLLTFSVLAAGARDRGVDVAGEIFEDALVIAESVITTGMVTIAVKSTIGRERPFVRDLPAGHPVTNDLNLSFFSGHASLSFAAVVSAGTVAYLRDDPHAPWVFILGMPAAVGTGYLRIAGDKHYFTDVLVGAAVGSAIGWAVPTFLHTGERPAAVPMVTLSGGKPMLMWSGEF